MNICTIITSFYPGTAYGGPINSTMQRVEELIRQGHQVTILTSYILDPKTNEKICEGEEIFENGLRVIRFKSINISKHFSGIFSFDVIKWLKKNIDRFDIFHVSYPRELFPISCVSFIERRKKKIFLQTHGMLDRREFPRNFIDLFYAKPQLRKATGVVVLQEYEEHIIKSICSQANVYLIPNGIGSISNIPEWMGGNKIPSILFLARLHPRKRVLDFILAANLVLQINPDINFRIVGPDGGDEENARRLVKDLGIQNNIYFIGSVPREKALVEYSKSDIYVLPSIDEPFATSITESLAVGVPVIVTNTIHNLNMLKKYDSVEIVEPNPKSISNGILRLLSNPSLCKARSDNGKALIKNELLIDKTIKKIIQMYCD